MAGGRGSEMWPRNSEKQQIIPLWEFLKLNFCFIHMILFEVNKSTWCPLVSTCTRYKAVMKRWTYYVREILIEQRSNEAILCCINFWNCPKKKNSKENWLLHDAWIHKNTEPPSITDTLYTMLVSTKHHHSNTELTF